MREEKTEKYAVWFVIAAIILIVVGGSIANLDEEWFGSPGRTGTHEGWRTIIYGVAAFVGFILLAWRSYNADRQTRIANRQHETTLRQTDLIERGQATDRLTKAVEQLSSDKLYERIGGVHALNQIANNAETSWIRDQKSTSYHAEDLDAVVTVLKEFIRTTPYREQQRHALEQTQKGALVSFDNRNAEGDDRDSVILIRCPDLEGAFSVLQSLADKIDEDFQNCLDVTGANLSFLDVSGFYMSDMCLALCDFRGSDFATSDLSGSDICGAMIIGCNLFRTDFSYTHLSNAEFTNSDEIDTAIWHRAWYWSDLKPIGLPDDILTQVHAVDPDLDTEGNPVSLWLRPDTPVVVEDDETSPKC